MSIILNQLPSSFLPALIVFASFAVFLRYRSVFHLINKEVISIKENINASSPLSGADVVRSIKKAKFEYNVVLNIIEEILNGSFKINNISYTIKPMSDVLDKRYVLSKKINVDIFESVPNMIIGIGLALTFLLLAMVLGNAGEALTDGSQTAIQELLKNASSKFWISVAALLCSILFSVFIKNSYKRLQNGLEELIFLLEKSNLSHFGAEQAIIEQMQLMHSISKSSESTASQTDWKQARFFEEIANSVGNAVSPLMKYNSENNNKILRDIKDAIVYLSDTNSKNILELANQVKEINENAMRKMIDDFRHSLTAASSTEIQRFQETMKNLSNDLNNACLNLVTALPTAATTCTDTLIGYTSQWSNHLKETVNENSVQLSAVSTQIKENIQITQTASDNMARILSDFINVSSAAKDTIQMTGDMAKNTQESLLNTTSKIEKVFDSIRASMEKMSQIAQPSSEEMIFVFKNASNSIENLDKLLKSVIDEMCSMNEKLSSVNTLNDDFKNRKRTLDDQKNRIEELLQSIKMESNLDTSIELDNHKKQFKIPGTFNKDGNV